MTHLGSPTDLQSSKPAHRVFICIVASTNGDGILSFDHKFTVASSEEEAYDSPAMSSLETEAIMDGFSLVNNYVAEV